VTGLTVFGWPQADIERKMLSQGKTLVELLIGGGKDLISKSTNDAVTPLWAEI
jgi:hypothetical protein